MKFIAKTLFFSFSLFVFSLTTPLFAQQKMSLQECINYALENNYTIKQKLLEKESKKVQLQAAKVNTAPSIGANVGQTFDFGRAALASAIVENTTQATTNFGIGLNMDVFQGFRNYHQIKSDKLDLEATRLDIEAAKENIELLVTAYYLQILLHKEMLEILKNQTVLAQEQVDRISILVANGKSSDAELYVAKATLAQDQLSVVEANNNVRLSILDLAQLMNFMDVSNFDIVTENILDPIEEILHTPVNVNHVVENALEYRPAIRAALARIEHAKRTIKVYQSGWYPTLGLNASFGTGYFYRFQELASYPNEPFGMQFKNNARTSIGVSLYVPIFDKLVTLNNVKQRKISVKIQELHLEETKRTLIKEIEQAYVNAVASKEKYLASQVAHTSSQVAFQYEELKFNAGSSTTYEYNEAKNKFLQSQSKLIQSKFDFLFRIKILEFYGKY